MLAAGGGSAAGQSATHGAAVSGGTVYFAEAPGAPPANIWPLSGPQYNTQANINLFVDLLYPPLYALGVGTAANVNYQMSLANPPVYSDNDTTVTLTLKPYKWSDGESLSARDVLFFLHLVKAEKTSWGPYSV